MLNRELLPELFNAAITTVDPYRAVNRALRIDAGRLHAGGSIYELAAFDRIMVVGAGKATARMAEAVEKAFGSAVTSGIIMQIILVER